MVHTIDAYEHLMMLLEKKPHLLKSIEMLPNANISTDDGMLSPTNPGYYFECGLQAAHLCRFALEKNGVGADDVRNVLDYACGYGRVGRALQVTFSRAQLLGVDVDPKAIRHYQHVLGVETQQISRKVDAALSVSGEYDLIWVGSLFTHLPEFHVDALLKDLSSLLAERGVLAFTLHGDYVVGRLESGEKDYGLDADGIALLLREFKSKGYAFSAYPNVSGYGISATSRAVMESKIDTNAFRLLDQKDRGWMRHQDFYALAR